MMCHKEKLALVLLDILNVMVWFLYSTFETCLKLKIRINITYMREGGFSHPPKRSPQPTQPEKWHPTYTVSYNSYMVPPKNRTNSPIKQMLLIHTFVETSFKSSTGTVGFHMKIL